MSLKRARRSLLEEHHVGGASNDPLTVVLCLNCHREQTTRQPGTRIELEDDPERTFLEKLIAVLRGLAQFFDALARSLMS